MTQAIHRERDRGNSVPLAPRYHSSRSPEQSFTRIRQWQHPGRREHVHGRIKSDLDNNSIPLWAWLFVIACLLPFALPMIGAY